jgi:hypothetical protein
MIINIMISRTAMRIMTDSWRVKEKIIQTKTRKTIMAWTRDKRLKDLKVKEIIKSFSCNNARSPTEQHVD